MNWKALSNFKLAFEAATKLQTPSVQVLGDKDPDEGLGSSAKSDSDRWVRGKVGKLQQKAHRPEFFYFFGCIFIRHF